MIVRLSAKIAKKIRVTPPTESLPAAANSFTDWSTHLFTADRTQYIFVSNTASLYSMVMYARGATNDNSFIQRITNFMSEFIGDDGYPFIYERIIAPQTGRISFSKALNRSFTGSMNELVKAAQYYLIEDDMSPYEVSSRLNDVLLSYLDYQTPRQVFESLTVHIREQIEDSDNPTQI